MKYIYFLILCVIITLIIAFRSYKKELYKDIPSKDAPFKFMYGFAILFIGKFDSEHTLKLKLRTASICISAFTIFIFIGLITSFDVGTKLPDNTKQPSIALEVADKDITENSSSSTDHEKFDYAKEAVAVFEKYREGIEETFLGENDNFFSITKSLNLIDTYGEENVIISWEFETENIIDSNGNILYENIGSEGCSTIAYAHLSLNQISATLSIPIYISPP